jgi:release factor glutamine methyltransferase
MASSQPTVVAAVLDAARALEAAGFTSEDSRREATLLAREHLGWDSAHYLVRQHDPAPADLVARLASWTLRRAAREPLAYIVGRREFYGRMFSVTRDVLIPRPESELLVDAALGFLRGRRDAQAPPQMLDIGTGSGCLAITLALEWPQAHVTATDISAAALRVAAANAAQLGASGRVTFVHAPLAAGATAAYDVVVSNPPYVADADREGLAADVREYEPASALFGGRDGLDVIRALIPAAHRALRPGGLLAVEFGYGQADAVRALLTAGRWIDLEVRPDLAGIPRIIAARCAGDGADP